MSKVMHAVQSSSHSYRVSRIITARDLILVTVDPPPHTDALGTGEKWRYWKTAVKRVIPVGCISKKKTYSGLENQRRYWGWSGSMEGRYWGGTYLESINACAE